MSAPVVRAAIRNAATSARAVAPRRQFSVMRSLRSFARSFEPHPFERLPVTTNAQAADWGRQVKRVGSQAVVYLPGAALLLGWPYAASTVLDGHI